MERSRVTIMRQEVLKAIKEAVTAEYAKPEPASKIKKLIEQQGAYTSRKYFIEHLFVIFTDKYKKRAWDSDLQRQLSKFLAENFYLPYYRINLKRPSKNKYLNLK